MTLITRAVDQHTALARSFSQQCKVSSYSRSLLDVGMAVDLPELPCRVTTGLGLYPRSTNQPAPPFASVAEARDLLDGANRLYWGIRPAAPSLPRLDAEGFRLPDELTTPQVTIGGVMVAQALYACVAAALEPLSTGDAAVGTLYDSVVGARALCALELGQNAQAERILLHLAVAQEARADPNVAATWLYLGQLRHATAAALVRRRGTALVLQREAAITALNAARHNLCTALDPALTHTFSTTLPARRRSIAFFSRVIMGQAAELYVDSFVDQARDLAAQQHRAAALSVVSDAQKKLDVALGPSSFLQCHASLESLQQHLQDEYDRLQDGKPVRLGWQLHFDSESERLKEGRPMHLGWQLPYSPRSVVR